MPGRGEKLADVLSFFCTCVASPTLHVNSRDLFAHGERYTRNNKETVTGGTICHFWLVSTNVFQD